MEGPNHPDLQILVKVKKPVLTRTDESAPCDMNTSNTRGKVGLKERM